MAFNNGIPENIDILDLLNVFSLWAQIDNMKMDAGESFFIRKVIKAIANEIEKLHKENELIMQQNEEILNLLKKMYSDSIDDRVEYWHTHDTGISLQKFLGMSDEEYENWGKGIV